MIPGYFAICKYEKIEYKNDGKKVTVQYIYILYEKYTVTFQ